METTKGNNMFVAVRHTVAALAVCVIAAVVATTWLGSAPADAAPAKPSSVKVAKKSPAPARSAGDTASADDGDDDAPSDDTAPRAKKAKKQKKALAGTLNLNTATEAQLRMLPGVGPAKAQRILDFRKSKGNFQRVRDLRRVKGFGYKTMQTLTPYLSVTGDSTLKQE